jgi:acid phosphatase
MTGHEWLQRSGIGLWLALTLLGAVPAAAATCPLPAPVAPFFAPHNGASKSDLLAYGCSGQYARDLADDIAAARAFIEARAATATKPAVVLDIDETALSNWRQMLANDFEFIRTGPCRIDRGGPCSQEGWEARAGGAAIVPMVDLVRAARARGVAIFFITGRRDTPVKRAAVVRNLRRAGYDGWSALVMRTPKEQGVPAGEYKSARRAAIAALGYTIIASIGDQWSDLDGGHAERTFKLVNPFYFIP